MKKTLLIVGLVVLALAALGVGTVLAQGGQPPFQGGGFGLLHDYVEKALAAKLDLTEKQIEEQLAAGKPMFQIALDNGVKQEDLATFMNEVHKTAFANAVKDGVLTQAQADFMLQRMQNGFQNGYGYGYGNCPMHNGAGYGPRGAGFGPGMMGRGFRWQTP